jgi:hypothetical protein
LIPRRNRLQQICRIDIRFAFENGHDSYLAASMGKIKSPASP